MVKPTENEALSVGGMDQPEDSQSVMVSLEMKGPHHAGTLFVNPLFEPKLMGAEKHVERTPNLYRLCCQNAERPMQDSCFESQAKSRPILVSIVQLAVCALAFLYLPWALLSGETLNVLNDLPKARQYCLLLYSGIIQSTLVEFTIPRQTRKKYNGVLLLSKLYLTLGFVIAITSSASLHFTNRQVGGLRQEQIVNFGNCTILENVPEEFVDFHPETGNGNQFLYGKSSHGFPLVYEFDRATLNIMGTLLSYFMSEDRLEKIKEKHCNPDKLRSLLLFSVFKPCDHLCQNTKHICDNSCRNCTVQLREIDWSLGDDDSRLWDNYESIFMSQAGPVFKLEYPSSSKTQEWGEQVFKRIIIVLRELRKSGKCKDKDSYDFQAGKTSCYGLDGRVYEPGNYPWVESEQNCTLPHANAYAARGTTKRARNEATGSQEPPVAIEMAILITFFLRGCFCLFLLARPVEAKVKVNGALRLHDFHLPYLSIFCLVVLGCLAWAISIALFALIIFKFEALYADVITSLSISIYFLLGGTAAGAFMVGASLTLGVWITGFEITEDRRVHSPHKRNRSCLMILKRTIKNFRKSISPKGGQYFYANVFVRELLEVMIQTIALYEFAPSKSQNFIFLSALLLMINISMAPLLVYQSVYSSLKQRTVNSMILMADTFIDAAYFCLNVYYILPEDLHGASSPLFTTSAIAWPVWSTMLRMRSLKQLLTRKRATRKLGRLVTAEHAQRGIPLFRIPCGKTLLIALVFLAVSCSIIQFMTVCFSIISINKACAEDFGLHMWEGAHPKNTFRNGIFGTPTCGYENIESIIAVSKGISHVSRFIGKCTKLKYLFLQDNHIADLPRELLLMSAVETVDMSNNPVFTRLKAKNMSLTGGIPVFIEKHMGNSLVYLDLSNNEIERVDGTVSTWNGLVTLDLRNNRILPDAVSWEIAKLSDSLRYLFIEGNPVSRSLEWSNRIGFKGGEENWCDGAVALLKRFFLPRLKSLNLSSNGFERKHYDALALASDSLESLDMSFNKIRAVAYEPLKLYNLTNTNTRFFSVEGNVDIQHIGNDDLVYMHNAMVKTAAVYIIRGTGIRTYLYNGNTANDIPENITFPGMILEQVKEHLHTLLLHWVHFEKSVLEQYVCTFPALTHFMYGITRRSAPTKVESWPIENAPGCLKNIQYMSFKMVKIEFSTKLNLARVRALTVWYNPYGNKMEFPGLTGTSNSTVLVSLRHGIAKNMSELLLAVAPVCRLQLVVLSKTRESTEIPTHWGSFDELDLSGHENGTHIFNGTIQHLTIRKLALFEGTNVSGPLFRVGSEFECMRLPGHKDSLAYFENKWGLDCSPAPIHLFASANRRSWLHYDAEESNLTNAINCTIPTHSNNEFVHVLCAAAKVFHYGPPFEDTFLWDCFRETLFFSETKYFKCFLNDLL
jgi:hypothetical protein